MVLRLSNFSASNAPLRSTSLHMPSFQPFVIFHTSLQKSSRIVPDNFLGPLSLMAQLFRVSLVGFRERERVCVCLFCKVAFAEA